MISRTIKTRWRIWMSFCPYSNIACDWSVCCVRRQRSRIVTSSKSIYKERKFARSARESKMCLCEHTPALFPNQRAYKFTSSGESTGKEPKGGPTYDWKAARQKPPHRNAGCQRQESQTCWCNRAPNSGDIYRAPPPERPSHNEVQPCRRLDWPCQGPGECVNSISRPFAVEFMDPATTHNACDGFRSSEVWIQRPNTSSKILLLSGRRCSHSDVSSQWASKAEKRLMGKIIGISTVQ